MLLHQVLLQNVYWSEDISSIQCATWHCVSNLENHQVGGETISSVKQTLEYGSCVDSYAVYLWCAALWWILNTEIGNHCRFDNGDQELSWQGQCAGQDSPIFLPRSVWDHVYILFGWFGTHLSAGQLLILCTSFHDSFCLMNYFSLL